MPVLEPTLQAQASAPPVAGSNLERAQVAAMAERMLESFRVGKVDGRAEVRLTLGRGSRHAGVEVRLREDGDEIVAELHDELGGDTSELAEAIQRELDARGARVRIER